MSDSETGTLIMKPPACRDDDDDDMMMMFSANFNFGASPRQKNGVNDDWVSWHEEKKISFIGGQGFGVRDMCPC